MTSTQEPTPQAAVRVVPTPQVAVRGATGADADRPTVSLVTATVGRPELFRRLVRSLVVERRSGADFEHIVVDMDAEQRTLAILEEEVGDLYPWTYVASTSRGGGTKRNEGLALARGDIIGFPDDDVWYTGSTIARVSEELREHPTLLGVTGRLLTEDGRQCELRWSSTRRPITKNNVHRTSVSATIFYRREALDDAGRWDETIGAGTDGWFQAGDESDVLLRVLAAGPVQYEPDLVIHHDHQDDMQEADRAFDSPKMLRYGSGTGRLWRRHGYSRWVTGWLLLRKVVKVCALVARRQPDQARSEAAWARGAVLGLLGREPQGIDAGGRVDRPETAGGHGDTTGEARSSFGWRLVVSVAGLSASLLLSVIIVRRLPPADVTAFFLLMTALMVAPVLGRLGIGTHAVREVSATRGTGDLPTAIRLAEKLLQKTVLPAIACAAVLAVGLVTLAQPARPVVAGLLTVVIITSEVLRTMVSDLFIGLGRVRLAAALTHNGRAVLVAVSVGAVLLSTDDLTFLVILSITAIVSAALLAAALARFRTVTGARTGRPAVTVARTGISFLVVEVIGVLVGRSDVWFAAWALDPTESAGYATASMVALQVITPIALASIALAPVISSMWASSRHVELERLLRAVATLALIVGVATVLFVAVFGRLLLGVAFGDEYRDAYGPLVILSAGNMLVALLGNSITLLLMTTFERLAARVAVVCITIGAMTMAAAAFLFGASALALASSFATVLFVVVGAISAYVATGIALLPMRVGEAVDVLRGERHEMDHAVAG